jgi:hypothetical protein
MTPLIHRQVLNDVTHLGYEIDELVQRRIHPGQRELRLDHP